MDAVTRQTGQHIEFEPEWEGAFNLQLRLADNIAVILDWCSSDVSDVMINLQSNQWKYEQYFMHISLHSI